MVNLKGVLITSRLTKTWKPNNCVALNIDYDDLLELDRDTFKELDRIIHRLGEFEDAQEQGLIPGTI